MFLVDANVLLSAVNTASAAHRPANRWLNDALSGTEPVAFAWIVLLAFLRIGTRAGVFTKPLSPKRALDMVEAWTVQPAGLIIHPTSRHFAALRGLIEEAGTAGNLTTDAHLAALAVEHGAELVSFDRDFQRFPGVRLRLLATAGR